VAPGGAEGEPDEELPGEETAGGARRFAVGGERPPRLNISNISGSIQVRGDEAAGNQITVRAINEHGQEVPLGEVAELTYAPDGPGGEPTLKVQPRANVHRQIRRVRDAVNFSKVSFLENIGELVEAVTTIGREWSTVNFEAIVPRRCDLDLQNASREIEVEGVEGTAHLRCASGPISLVRLRGNVAAQTASGEISAERSEGVLYLRTVSGEIKAEQLSGKLVIQTASGDVEARRVGGQLGFKSVSGDLEVYGSVLSGLYLSSTSGDCAIDATLEPGDHEVRTVSGDLILRVQPDFSATMTGRTVSGNFRSEIEYRAQADREEPRVDDEEEDPFGRRKNKERKERRRARNRWEFLIGDPREASLGRTRLRIRTVSGDVAIKRARARHQAGAAWSAQPAQPAQAAQPVAPATGEARGEGGNPKANHGHEEHHWPETELYRSEAQAEQPEETEQAGQSAPLGQAVQAEQPPEVEAADQPDRAEQRERSRLEILQAVERKEITIEEAMALLRDLEETA
jgi:DUF4097 and DUF4098 domain-containing protein YvlB